MKKRLISEAMRSIGSIGGKTTKKRYGKGHYKKISALGVAARKKKNEISPLV